MPDPSDENSPTIEHDPNEKRSKYPRKLWFGLTDYGPPKQDAEFWIATAIIVTVLYFAKHFGD